MDPSGDPGHQGVVLNAIDSKGKKLKFTSVAFYIDKGVKHTHHKTLRNRNGTKKRVIVIVFRVNARTHHVPGTLELSVAGLSPGVHTLKVTVSFKETERKHGQRRTVTVTKTLTTKFGVC